MMTYSTPNFISYPQLASTNSELKRLLSTTKMAEYSLVITKHQTAGKGQMGNSWESEAHQNLTFSLLLRPTFLPPHLQFYISKAVSLALVDTIKQTAQLDASIKWPNDIYVGDKKICGILIENSIVGSRLDYCIVGIGLNINQKHFISDAPNPVSLKQLTGKSYSIETVLELLLDNIEYRYHQLEIDRLELVSQDYTKALYRGEGFHSFKDDSGTFEARISSISEMGLLTLVDTSGKEREYAFKEVSFVV